VRELLDFVEGHPRVGIAGSYIHGPDGETHITAFRFPTLASELEGTLRLGIVSRLLRRWIVAPPVPVEASRVDWLAGASMLIRREAFEAIGLLDETFFLYFEETDFCRRALNAGWPTWYIPSSRVTHIGSASTGIQDVSRRMPPYWFASRKRYFRKHHGTAYLWLANLLWILGFSAWRVRRALMRRPDPDPPRMLWDFVRHTLARTDPVPALSNAGCEAENGSSAHRLRHPGADDHGIPPLEDQADHERETE
jgi:GT2 family glycosyltransferase